MRLQQWSVERHKGAVTACCCAECRPHAQRAVQHRHTHEARRMEWLQARPARTRRVRNVNQSHVSKSAMASRHIFDQRSAARLTAVARVRMHLCTPTPMQQRKKAVYDHQIVHTCI